MKETFESAGNIYEPVEFAQKFLTDRLDFSRIPGPIAIHATCSTLKLGLEAALLELARRCSDQVIVPEGIECCGWAGDRGFTFPELNASALSSLKDRLPHDCRQGYSTSRTCEIGLSHHSGIEYRSILYLVEECTRKGGARSEIVDRGSKIK
jgi:D-lactate dehydrogenase